MHRETILLGSIKTSLFRAKQKRRLFLVGFTKGQGLLMNRRCDT
jgi:hypothetical protein